MNEEGAPTLAKSKQRRKIIKNLLLTSGGAISMQALPDKWVKPVINSTVLPAHAECTGLKTCEG